MNEKLKRLYEELGKHYELPDYDTFAKDLTDPAKSRILYDELVKDNFDVPDYEVFIDDLGLKKKDIPSYWTPSKELFAEGSKHLSKEISEETEEIRELPEHLKTPDLLLTPPAVLTDEEAAKYPQYTFKQALFGSMDRSIKEERFKEQAKERIAEIDERLKELPPAKMQIADVAYGVDVKFKLSAEDEEKLELQKERKQLELAITVPKKGEYFFKKMYLNSILGTALRLTDEEYFQDMEQWLAKYDASALEDIGSAVLGMVVLDSPFFMATGSIGARGGTALAQMLTKKSIGKSIDVLFKSGIEKGLAEKLIKVGADKLATNIARVSSSATAIGSYRLVSDALNEWSDPDIDFKDIEFGKVFRHGLQDFILGGGIEGIGIGTSLIAQKARAIPSALGRTLTQPLISTAGLTAESALFATGGAWFEGRPVTKEDFANTMAFLTGLKTIHAIERPGRVLRNIYRSSKFDPKKPGEGIYSVDIFPWEINSLGEKDYKSLMLNTSKSNEKLASILNDDNIPALLKQKVLWGSKGVGMENVTLTADRVERNKEFVDVYNKEDVLVDRRRFRSEEEAQQEYIDLGLRIEDGKLRAGLSSNTTDQLKILQQLEKEGIKVPELLAILDKPITGEGARTPEEKKIVSKLKEIVNANIKPEVERPEVEEELSIGEKTFAGKEELFKYLDEVAFDKELKRVKERWMPEGAEIPNTATLKAITEWEAGKRQPQKPSVYREITAEERERLEKEGRKPPRIRFKPESRTGQALSKTPNDFIESTLQFFIDRGTISREDFKANTGWSEEDIKKSGIEFLLSREGQKLDLFHESLENAFQYKEGGEGMDMINEVVDLMSKYPTRAKMLAELERRQKAPELPEITEDEFIKDIEEARSEDIEELAPESLKEILASKELMSVFESNRYVDEKGNIDWKVIKGLVEKDPAHFTDFPFQLTEKEFNLLKELTNDTERQRLLEEKFTGITPTEGGVERNIIRRGVAKAPGRAKGEGKEEPAKPEYTSEQQKRIDTINKEYDEKIAEKQKELDKIPKQIIKAINDANKRLGLFGDLKPEEVDEILRREEQGFQVTSETVNKIRKPFLEKKAELRKEIDVLNKERESKIGEVLKQLNLFPPEKKPKPPLEQKPSKPEAFATSKSKGEKERRVRNKKMGYEPVSTKPEEMAWDEPLPLSVSEDPNFLNSDLNNKMSQRNIGRRYVHRLGAKEGEKLRFSFLRVFKRNAAGLYDTKTGIITVKSLRDLRRLIHEFAHALDAEIFDIRGMLATKPTNVKTKVVGRYSEIADAGKIKGVRFRNRVYKTVNDINNIADIKSEVKQQKINQLNLQLRARDTRLDKFREQFGDDVVAGVLQRETFKQELKQLLIDTGYPEKKTTEGIAEMMYYYVAERSQLVRSTPNMLAWFDKFLENVPKEKEAFNQMKEWFDFKKTEDIRDRLVAEVMRSTDDPDTPWMNEVTLVGNKVLWSMVNHLHGRRLLEKNWGLIKGDIENFAHSDQYVLAKEMLGMEGRVAAALLHKPFIKRQNEIIFRDDIKSLIGEILKPLLQGKSRDYHNYETYLVVLDSIESHARGVPEQAYFDLESAQAGKKAFEEQYGASKLIEFSSEIQKWNHWLLDYGKEAGLFSPETVEYWKKIHQNYAPLARIADIQQTKGLGYKVTQANVGKAIRARKGSEKQIKPVFDSLIDNAYRIMTKADQNILNRSTVDNLLEIHNANKKLGFGGLVIREIGVSKMISYVDNITGETRWMRKGSPPKWYGGFSKQWGVITVYEGGLPRFYEVAPDYFGLIYSQENRMRDIGRKLVNWTSKPSQWLRAGAVILDPTFPIRNVFRDQISAWFYSKYRYVPPYHFMQGIFSALKKDDYYQKWLAGGGDQSFLVSADMMLSKDFAKRQLGDVGKRKLYTYAKNPLRALQDFSRLSEMGTRLGAFRNAYKKTGNVHLAVVESRDVSADYGIHGAIIRSLLPYMPFFNARLQHARMSVEATRKPALFAIRGLALVVPTIINWALNNKDEEMKELYQGLPMWRRMALFNIHIPGTDRFFPIPKGFFGAMFGGMTEAILDKALADDPRAAESILKQMYDEITPAGTIYETIPFPARPIVENKSNIIGWTGQQLVPEYMKSLDPELQYFASTTEVAKKIGEALNWSPIRIEHYVRSYFAGAGIGALRLADELLQLAGIVEKKPETTFNKLSKLPLTKAFVTERPVGARSQYVTDFYETLNKMESVNMSVSKLLDQEDDARLEKLLSDPENEKMFAYYSNNSTAINAFRNSLTAMREYSYSVMKDDNLTMKEKKEEIRKIEDIIQETALLFKKSWDDGVPFDYNNAMDEVVKKVKSERKEERERYELEKNIYNAQWQYLRSENKNTFELLKSYGGLKELNQKRSVKDHDTGETVDLSFHDTRKFNEILVINYAEMVENIIGKTESNFKILNVPSDKDPEKTELERLLQMAWDKALDKTKNEFEIIK